MGFDLHRFPGKIEDEWKCGVCFGLLDNPLTTPCGHNFCAACILPWVVQHATCPHRSCETSQSFTTKELDNVPRLRNTILALDIHCEFVDRGCKEVVKVQFIDDHLDVCDFRPLVCKNKGCGQTLNAKEKVTHEQEFCDYRPVGQCTKGCGLMLLFCNAADHDCVRALVEYVESQDIRTNNLEQEMKRLATRFSKREKSLLAQVAALHSEIQLQALKFQKKMSEYRTQIASLAHRAAFQPNKVQSNTRIPLHIENINLYFIFSFISSMSIKLLKN